MTDIAHFPPCDGGELLAIFTKRASFTGLFCNVDGEWLQLKEVGLDLLQEHPKLFESVPAPISYRTFIRISTIEKISKIPL